MDHDRVNISSTNMSCGVAQLSRISEDTDGALYAIASRLYHPSRGDPYTFIMFSDLGTEETSSSRLAQKINELSFGTVIISSVQENPKTGNFIVVYVWAIQHVNFKKWYASTLVKKLSKVGS